MGDLWGLLGIWGQSDAFAKGGSNRREPRFLQRCRSQRQMEASSHTAIRMLLSRLKLVCRMADVHLGRVSVVHLRGRKKPVSWFLYYLSGYGLTKQTWMWPICVGISSLLVFLTYLALCGSSTSRSQTYSFPTWFPKASICISVWQKM